MTRMVSSSPIQMQDRSDAPAKGTAVMLANFKTLETLTIAKETLESTGLEGLVRSAEGGQLDAAAAADRILAEARDNVSLI